MVFIWLIMVNNYITGWWCNNHLEKWWSSSMGRIIIISYMKWKIKHVWNHQPGNMKQVAILTVFSATSLVGELVLETHCSGHWVMSQQKRAFYPGIYPPCWLPWTSRTWSSFKKQALGRTSSPNPHEACCISQLLYPNFFRGSWTTVSIFNPLEKPLKENAHIVQNFQFSGTFPAGVYDWSIPPKLK